MQRKETRLFIKPSSLEQKAAAFEVIDNMKKTLIAALILAAAVGTVYSTVNWRSAASPLSTSTVASDPLELMPDSDFVMFVNAGQFFATKLYSSITNDPKASADIRKFETDALKYGIDVKQIKQVAVGVRTIPGSKEGNFYAIVTGGFDREKLLSGIASNPDKVSMASESYGDRTLYIITPKEKAKPSNPDNPLGAIPQSVDKVGMAFLNPGMLVLGNIAGVKNTIDVQTGKQPNVLTNQRLSGYISALNTSALIRFAGIAPEKSKAETANKAADGSKKKVLTNEELDGPSKPQAESASSGSPEEDPTGMMGGMQKMAEAIQGGFGSVDFSTGFNLDSTMQIRTENEARQISQSLNGLIGLGRMMLAGQNQSGKTEPSQAKFLELINQISISDTGKDVKITMNVSEQLFQEIMAAVEAEQKKKAQKAQ